MSPVVLLGVSLGGGLIVLLKAALPLAPVDLVASMARIDPERNPRPVPWWAGAVQRLTVHSESSSNRWTGTPVVALRLIDQTSASYLKQRVGYALSGAFLGAALGWRAGLVLALPLAVLAVGATASVVPWYRVRHQADLARTEFLRALAVLFDLTAQERDAGRAPGQALLAAAAVPDSWPVARVRSRLRSAQRLGTTPWDALTALAAELDVEELRGLAAVIAAAGDGASISKALHAKASALRATAIAQETAAAQRRSELLFLPVALLVIGFLGLLLHPMLAQIPHG